MSIKADIVESFLGAMFLDQGWDFVKNFVAENIFKFIDKKVVFFADYKSTMKEYGDANEMDVSYEILEEYGVPHDKIFIIAIMVDGKEMGVGKGRNKKEAEQAAAKIAIEKLNIKGV